MYYKWKKSATFRLFFTFYCLFLCHKIEQKHSLEQKIANLQHVFDKQNWELPWALASLTRTNEEKMQT